MAMESNINFEQIKDISEGDRDFEQEIITMYLEDTRGRIQTLESHLAEQNWEHLKREAHTLKGSSGNIGVDCTFKLCKQLEQASLDQDEQKAKELVASIKTMTEEVAELFKSYLASP